MKGKEESVFELLEVIQIGNLNARSAFNKNIIRTEICHLLFAHWESVFYYLKRFLVKRMHLNFTLGL